MIRRWYMGIRELSEGYPRAKRGIFSPAVLQICVVTIRLYPNDGLTGLRALCQGRCRGLDAHCPFEAQADNCG